MSIINQPRDGNLLTQLVGLLTGQDNFRGYRFFIVSAYAKKSGTDLLSAAIKFFREKGGEVISVIGVDQRNTSIQALRVLLSICDKLYIYHNNNLSRTFHPKIYVLEKAGQTVEVFIGSSNLTGGGLKTNYECVKRLELSSQVATDLALNDQIKSILEFYQDTTSPCCQLADEQFLSRLLELNYVENEEIRQGVYFRSGESTARNLFGTEKFAPPSVTVVEELDSGIESLDEGFWKVLSRFDVSPTSAPGQIIIPIRYLTLFPPFSTFEEMPSHGRQAEVFFNVIFIDPQGKKKRINNVRTMIYIPAPTHLRPNQELRFTFRHHPIFSALEEGDILEFKRSNNVDVWFLVRLIKKTSKENKRLAKRGRYGTVPTSR